MEDLIQNIRDLKDINSKSSKETLGFKNVTFGFDNKETIFENANFTFSNNGLVLFKGNNGTGKTTIFKLLSGFKEPKSGTVTCSNNNIIGYSSAKGDDINSYIKCDSFLFDCLGNLKSQYMSKVLDFLNLKNCRDHRIIELSTGQRKKLSIFRVFTKSHFCMFLDEPLSHLDINFQETVIQQIRVLKKTMSIVIATHTDRFDTISNCIYEINNKSINKIKNSNHE